MERDFKSMYTFIKTERSQFISENKWQFWWPKYVRIHNAKENFTFCIQITNQLKNTSDENELFIYPKNITNAKS